MVKKIKKNSSYSYNDRNIKPSSSDTPKKLEESQPDLTGKDAAYTRRFLAYMFDLATYLPIAYLFQYTTRVLRAVGGAENERNAIYMTVSIIIYALLLFGYLPNRWKGQTLGKKVLKIRVVPTNGVKIDFAKYLIREFLVKITIGWLCMPVVGIYAIYQVFIAKETKPILLHDKLMSTRVVAAEK
ncbi:RDD family protein [Gemella cuniculi]|uniref:RDD family protein n=1 Tax=Gemella cuniculi TaxID=150240 RepID=UPI000415BA5A|nr:RDD family protein [Gemella cuniculi]